MTVELVSDRAAPAAPTNDGLSPGMLVAELNHRIANNLTLIAGLVRMQAASVAKAGAPLSAEAAFLLLEEVGSRIETVGQLHRLLAQRGAGASLDLGRYLRDIAEAAVGSMAPRGETRLAYTSTRCEIGTDQALPLGFIVGELATNAVKYAHPAGVAGRLTLGCHARPGGATLIEVSDDGVGLPEGFDPRTDGGLGMRMVRRLADQLNATLTFNSSAMGLTVRLLAPPGALDGEG